MEDVIKNLVYTGVGLVAFTAEKVKESIDKLVSEDKISPEEGRRIVDEFMRSTEEKKNMLESQLIAVVNELKSKIPMIGGGGGSGSADRIADLEARIEALEAKATKK
jgi:polyhydroxyalkanoate synthesis regulator phasin